MTQERMIRIPNWEDLWYVRVYHHNSIDEYPDDLYHERLEPVPPKEWRPLCFYDNQHDKVVCQGKEVWIEDLIRQTILLPVCQECIYRKKNEREETLDTWKNPQSGQNLLNNKKE